MSELHDQARKLRKDLDALERKRAELASDAAALSPRTKAGERDGHLAITVDAQGNVVASEYVGDSHA